MARPAKRGRGSYEDASVASTPTPTYDAGAGWVGGGPTQQSTLDILNAKHSSAALAQAGWGNSDDYVPLGSAYSHAYGKDRKFSTRTANRSSDTLVQDRRRF